MDVPNMPEITGKEYTGLQWVYHQLNYALFGGELPDLLITYQRKAGARGYYSPDRFEARGTSGSVPELALNPATFEARSDLEILSTLAHEMVHHWQYCYGTPSRKGYHNREWADKMETIGLMPSTTGEPGGGRVGQHVTHYIISGGKFERAAASCLADNVYSILGYQSVDGTSVSKKPVSKLKYTCPCGNNVWGRPGLALICGECGEAFAAAE